MRDYRGEGWPPPKKKNGIGNVKAEKWNMGESGESGDNLRSVRQAKQEAVGAR